MARGTEGSCGSWELRELGAGSCGSWELRELGRELGRE